MPSCPSRWRLKAVNQPYTPSSCSCILVVHAQCVFHCFPTTHLLQFYQLSWNQNHTALPFLPLPWGYLFCWRLPLLILSSSMPCYCVHFWRPGAVLHLSRWPPCQIHLNFRLHPQLGETVDGIPTVIGQCLRLVIGKWLWVITHFPRPILDIGAIHCNSRSTNLGANMHNLQTSRRNC